MQWNKDNLFKKWSQNIWTSKFKRKKKKNTHTLYKINFKQIAGLNVKYKFKTPRKQIRKYLDDAGQDDDLLYKTLTTRSMKQKISSTLLKKNFAL